MVSAGVAHAFWGTSVLRSREAHLGVCVWTKSVRYIWYTSEGRREVHVFV